MTIAISTTEVAFAEEIDRLGAQGLTQEQIAARVGLSVSQIRYRLGKSHLTWATESRVRSDLSKARLEDAIASGEFTPAEMAEATQEEPAVA